MTKQTSNRPVHLYDTQLHRIVCGSPVAEDHSTKHARGVTCPACMTVLHERATEGAASSAAAASSNAGA